MNDQITPPQKPKNVPLAWTAPVHPHHEHSTRWFIGAGCAAALCIVYALFSGGWSFALVILLVAGAYIALHKTPPAMGNIRIDEEGVTWNGKLYLWGSMKDFWIVRLPDYNELHMVKRNGMLEIVIQTNDIPSPDLRATLSQFLPERADQGERLIDKIIRLTKL